MKDKIQQMNITDTDFDKIKKDIKDIFDETTNSSQSSKIQEQIQKMKTQINILECLKIDILVNEMIDEIVEKMNIILNNKTDPDNGAKILKLLQDTHDKMNTKIATIKGVSNYNYNEKTDNCGYISKTEYPNIFQKFENTQKKLKLHTETFTTRIKTTNQPPPKPPRRRTSTSQNSNDIKQPQKQQTNKQAPHPININKSSSKTKIFEEIQEDIKNVDGNKQQFILKDSNIDNVLRRYSQMIILPKRRTYLENKTEWNKLTKEEQTLFNDKIRYINKELGNVDKQLTPITA
jgi:hypothetical protein